MTIEDGRFCIENVIFLSASASCGARRGDLFSLRLSLGVCQGKMAERQDCGDAGSGSVVTVLAWIECSWQGVMRSQRD